MAESILFVDDDGMVLNALERTFFETEYTTSFALSADDAVAILASGKIDMVVSDIRMHPVSGYEFLKRVRRDYPDVLRVVLSAYGERPAMIKVIGEGVAKVYLLKPWDNQRLISQITHLFSVYRSLEDLRSNGFFSDERHLPVVPSLYSQMVQMVETERSLKEIAAVIESDACCTVNILKVVNSSFYGLSISTVHQALVYLGVNNIKDILLFSEISSRPYEGPEKELRAQITRHLLCTSQLFHGLHLHLLARRIPEEFSVAGLLADIGRLILLEYRPEQYRKVTESVSGDTVASLADSENRVMGISHTRLGALLLDWWNLPTGLVEACLYHHEEPFAAQVLPWEVIALIHLADCYAWKFAEGIGDVVAAEAVMERLSVTREQVEESVEKIREECGY